MAKQDLPQPRRKGTFITILAFAFLLLILFDHNLRDRIGRAVGVVMEPVIGFNDGFPVLTLFLAANILVIVTTVLRHFTTDWLEQAKNQAHMRAFQKEFSQARKENNTYRLKALQDQQPEVLKKQQEQSARMLKTMPLTMVVVIPLFAWMLRFVDHLDHPFYSTPWNPQINMFETTVFPNWILLYVALSIPFGILAQKAMKYLSWRERWNKQHPDVHG